MWNYVSIHVCASKRGWCEQTDRWSVYTSTHRGERDSKKQAAGQSRGRLRQRRHSQMQQINTHANTTVHPCAVRQQQHNGALRQGTANNAHIQTYTGTSKCIPLLNLQMIKLSHIVLIWCPGNLWKMSHLQDFIKLWLLMCSIFQELISNKRSICCLSLNHVPHHSDEINTSLTHKHTCKKTKNCNKHWDNTWKRGSGIADSRALDWGEYCVHYNKMHSGQAVCQDQSIQLHTWVAHQITWPAKQKAHK